MKLNKEDVNLFYKLMEPLLFYTNQKYPVIKELKEPTLKNRPPAEIVGLYDKLFSHPELIDSFVDENPLSFIQEELEIIKSWKNFIKGNFLIMVYLRDYTAFMSVGSQQKVYGVFGLYDKIRDVTLPFVPQFVDTILLPFKGKIVYCGYIHAQNVHIGENLKRSLMEEYYKARRKFGVITSLDELTAAGVRK
ncbi:MAG: hypothetical protein MUO76_15790 [Anaerolineaceae bacterium]|nr:hypothetical protein [Anaerolineaceae bacterium]